MTRPGPSVSNEVGAGPRHTRFTVAEQQSLLTLWAMARSPLIVGANLSLLDDATTRLLTNKEVLNIDQTATSSRQVLREGDLVVWTADLPNHKTALALFNVGEQSISVNRPLTDYALKGGSYQIRNVWSGSDSKSAVTVTRTIEPHACVLLIIK